jgi:hypothetical protein
MAFGEIPTNRKNYNQLKLKMQQKNWKSQNTQSEQFF